MRTFLEIGLSNAIMAFALALLVAGAGLFCRRPAIRHTLWLLVLLKLITPPFVWVAVQCPQVLEEMLHSENVVRAQAGFLASERNEPFHERAFDFLLDDGEQAPGLDNPFAALIVEASPQCSANAEERTPPSSAPATGLTLRSCVPIVFMGWLTGSVLWFAVAGTRIYRFQRLLRYGRAAPAWLQEQTCLLAQRLDLACCPTVWLVPGRVSPLLWALGRSLYLVLPSDLLDRLGPEQRASLLAHELAHARRRDHWVRWIELVVTGLYWWLPAAWWARRELQQAEEESCDAWVVWTLPSAARAYAKALLQTVDFLDARPALPPVASGIGHLRLLRRRLTMIGRQPLYPQLPWPVCLGVIVIALLVLPFAPARLAAQSAEAKPASEVSAAEALVRAEQDSTDRDLERRLRSLEEKMDRLMQRLESQRSERPGERSSRESRPATSEEREKARADAERAKEKARADAEKAREKAEKAREKARADAEKAREKARADAEKAKAKAERGKELTRESGEGKGFNSEQVERLMREIQERLNRELSPERMEEIQKRVQEAVNKNINPARMEAIQRKVEEALKKSTAELDRAKQKLQQAAEQQRTTDSRQERSRDQEQRNLERRMDRLEQKMDRVIQALEKSGKSSTPK
jgi:beta-lactamase regulating signal transducer with metallopeptidase domain